MNRMLSMRLLHERDFVEVPEAGDALQDLVHADLPQEDHALGLGLLAHLGEGLALQDHLPDRVAQVEDLGDGRPALVAGPVALGTALGLVEVRSPVGLPGRARTPGAGRRCSGRPSCRPGRGPGPGAGPGCS